MDWIDWLVVWTVGSVLAAVAWSRFRAGAGADADMVRDEAEQRDRAAVAKRLEALGKVKAGKFGGLR